MSRCERYTRSSYRCADVWPWSVFTLAEGDSVCVDRTRSSLLHHRVCRCSLFTPRPCAHGETNIVCAWPGRQVSSADARSTHTHTHQIPTANTLPYDNRFNLRDNDCDCSLPESSTRRTGLNRQEFTIIFKRYYFLAEKKNCFSTKIEIEES